MNSLCQTVRLPLLVRSQRQGRQFFPILKRFRALSSSHSLPLQDSEISGRHVCYREIPGTQSPTIVYVPGLHCYSHMKGMMAQCLLRYCDINQYPCVVYDHECMGASHGNLNKVLFSHWVEDVHAVVNNLTKGPVVLVSVSMGCWLSLVAAEKMPERLHGMILYAPALNYVFPYYLKNIKKLPEKVRKFIESGGTHLLSHTFGDALLKKDFAEDSLKYEIDLNKPLDITCPVRIIHGLQDREVDPQQSVAICNALKSEDVKVIMRKLGLHQAETLPDIELILNSTDRLIRDYAVTQ